MSVHAPEQGAEFDWAAAEEQLSAIDYSRIPYIPRRWLWKGFVPVGNPVLYAAAGSTGKGMLFVGVAARVVLGLPFPGEDETIRRDPKRVVWIAGTEDDQFEDLAPRFRAAIRACVAEFGLDPELVGECIPGGCPQSCPHAIRLIHDLSEWRDGSPFEVPGDMTRLRAEVTALNALGGPPVGLVVLDPLADLLGEGATITSVRGARMVMRRIKRFARQADVGCVVIHHLTKDGKVSGSPAVLDSLRLAFVIEKADDNPEQRVIIPKKANITHGDPQRYAIVGSEPDGYVVFIKAEDQRDERVHQAAERARDEVGARAGADRVRPPEGTLHARVGTAAQDAGMWRVARRTEAGNGSKSAPARMCPDLTTRELAESAARNDAGADLTWYPGNREDMRLAKVRRADGSYVTYAVWPVRAR